MSPSGGAYLLCSKISSKLFRSNSEHPGGFLSRLLLFYSYIYILVCIYIHIKKQTIIFFSHLGVFKSPKQDGVCSCFYFLFFILFQCYTSTCSNCSIIRLFVCLLLDR